MPSVGSRRRQHRERHPSVSALLAAHPEELDPKKIIRRLAREKVAYAKTQGWSGPPFSPKILASIFGIRCKQVDFEIGSEGRLIRYPGGRFWIEYRGERLLERQNFTIAHEFAHTLFRDFCEYLPLMDTPGSEAAEKEFEYLCDVAAAEMLMPVEDVEACLEASIGACCETVLDLGREFEVSIDAAMHRTVELTDDVPCAAVFLTDQHGEHDGWGPLWVKYCWPNSQFKGFVRAGAMPPRNSVAVACYRGDAQTTSAAKETWWLYGKPRSWLVQAARLPTVAENPHYPKVVALLLPTGYKQSLPATDKVPT
jgi:hypothetical protein